jgi:hypothetical protein
LAARNPNTQLVIDHLGLQQPFEPAGAAQPWADLPKVLALAAYPNVAIKISGACALSHKPFPYDDIWDPLGAFSTPSASIAACGAPTGRAVKLLTYEQGSGVSRHRSPVRQRPRRPDGREPGRGLSLVAGSIARARRASPR